MYRFVLWLVPTVEKFPRRQKFLLGDRLQATALDVLERLVEATYTRDRRRHLTAATLGIEKLRLLLGHRSLQTTANYLRVATTCGSRLPPSARPRVRWTSCQGPNRNAARTSTERRSCHAPRSPWRRSSAATATASEPRPGPSSPRRNAG